MTLPGATLRSVDLKLTGSGFGAVPLDRVLGAIPTLFSMAAGTLKIAVEPVSLADVQVAWNRMEKGRRIVLMPYQATGYLLPATSYLLIFGRAVS
jgi:hypothetical protein